MPLSKRSLSVPFGCNATNAINPVSSRIIVNTENSGTTPEPSVFIKKKDVPVTLGLRIACHCETSIARKNQNIDDVTVCFSVGFVPLHDPRRVNFHKPSVGVGLAE